MRIKLEQIKALWFQAVTEARANPTKEQVLRAYAAQYLHDGERQRDGATWRSAPAAARRC